MEYSERRVRRILKGMGMKHAKPYQLDYRKPDDAEEKLKKQCFQNQHTFPP
jgi:putative transposase